MRGVAAGESIVIPVAGGPIAADLRVPERAIGLVIFAHGSGSSRFSSRNRAVAEFLEARRCGTLPRAARSQWWLGCASRCWRWPSPPRWA